MPHIKIVTDSSCDIPEALLRQFDITVLPLTIRWGGHTYLDRITISSEQLIQRLRTDPAAPEVQAPAIEDFTKLYRSMRDTCDGVISIHLSGKIDETVANASIAREAFGPIGKGGPFPIAVVDSLSVSMGLGWIVLEVARAAQAGLDLPRLASMANRMAGLSHVAFFAEQLDGLLRTGAASRIAAQLNSLSSTKPLLHLDEAQFSVYERTRTRAKARDALYNFVEDFPQIGQLAVLHVGAQVDLEHLMTRIGAIYSREQVLIIQPGPAVTSWLGPDALGVAVIEGEEVI